MMQQNLIYMVYFDIYLISYNIILLLLGGAFVVSSYEDDFLSLGPTIKWYNLIFIFYVTSS